METSAGSIIIEGKMGFFWIIFSSSHYINPLALNSSLFKKTHLLHHNALFFKLTGKRTKKNKNKKPPLITETAPLLSDISNSYILFNHFTKEHFCKANKDRQTNRIKVTFNHLFLEAFTADCLKCTNDNKGDART